jgi:hypothetical protein
LRGGHLLNRADDILVRRLLLVENNGLFRLQSGPRTEVRPNIVRKSVARVAHKPEEEREVVSVDGKGLTIDNAKQGLAITLGVKPEQITITISL